MLHANTLHELLAKAAAAAPDAPAYRYRDDVVTYRDWDAASELLSRRFAAAGVERGDVVALLLPSVPLYMVAYLAAARLGAITTGINARYRRHEIGHILGHSGAKLLLAVERWHDADFRETIDQLRPDLPELHEAVWVEANELRQPTFRLVQALADGFPQAPSVVVDPDDLVAIVFTSGTTGVPKGACYAHASILALAEIETRRYADGKIPFKKHLAAGLSFAHVGSMARIGIQISHVGVSIVHDTFDPRLVLETIERERLIHLGGIPTQVVMLLDHPERSNFDLSSLRSVLLGGAPSSPQLIERVRDTLGVTVSVRYSSTEVGIATASLPEDDVAHLISTVGKATAGVELRIVDQQNHPLPLGEVGEVVVRSPASMRVYWRAPELTAKAIDPEGWVHTGDLGSLDGDGYLRVKGRQSEMYIRGGYNVFPEEVENVLSRHPKIARVGVLGIQDETFGELGWAFVVARDPMSPPTLAELRDFVGGELASFKRPDGLTVVSELPLTPMFKVDKRALKSLPRD